MAETLAAVSFSQVMGGISAASGVISGVQGYQQGKTQEKVAQQNAELAQRQGDEEARQRRRRAELIQARARAAYGASGLDISEGTPAAVLAATAEEQERDILMARYSGNINASRERTNAKIHKGNAQGSLLGGVLESAGSSYSIWGGKK